MSTNITQPRDTPGPEEFRRLQTRLSELERQLAAIRHRSGELTESGTRRRADEALRDTSAKLEAFVESASQGVVAANAQGRIELVNAKTEEMFGYSRQELLGQELEMLLPERYRAIHASHRSRYFASPGVRPMGLGLELAGQRKDGSEFPIEIGLSYIRTRDGVLAMGLITDITERKRGEEVLRQSEQRLRLMVENLPAGAVYVEGNAIYFNRATERITGYLRSEISTVEEWFHKLYGKEHEAIRQVYEQDRAGGFSTPRTVAITRKDAQTRYVEFAAYGFEQGEVWLLYDVTELKRAEERTTLLREIHHRVKNNLQVVSSLLGLQSRSIPDEQTRRMFLESQNRIHTMALIHERLYQSDRLSEIDSSEYIRQLAGHLFRSYGVSSSRVRLVTEIDDLPLTMDTAVSCGLIINELVSNALKHGFPGGRGGELRIKLRRSEDGDIQLVVSDNGIGLPENVNLWSARSLGLRLVRTLADQLGATVDVRSTGGVETTLTFPVSA